jgi:histidinol-phosphate/aromatic aminotransferase/cobyric acid decarboxylase-like protein
MAEFVRITIGTVAENERLLEAAREIAQNSEVSAQL